MDSDFPPERKSNNQNQVADRFAVKDTGTRRPVTKTRGEQGARRILLWFGLGFIFIFIVALFIVAFSSGDNNLLSAFGVDTDIKAVLSRVSNVVFGVIFVCAIIALVIGGFLHLAALGEPNQIRRARRLLLRSGITLVVTAILWIIFTLLLGNVSLPTKQVDTGIRIVTEPVNLTGAAPFPVKFEAKGITTTGNFFSWDFGDGQTGTGPTLEHEFQSEGRFLVTLTITDAKGNDSEKTATVVINNIRPTASVVTLPTTGPVPLTVKFDATESTDPNGQITSYAWDFGDESPVTTEAIAEHIFTKEGTYTVNLTLTDNNFDKTVYPITIEALPPLNGPKIKLSSTPPIEEKDGKKTITGVKPLAVRLSAADSIDDGQIASYEWDYGDGDKPEQGKIVNHIFKENGTYNVMVKLKDNEDNLSQETITVVVGNPKQAPQAVITSTPALTGNGGALEGSFPFPVSFNAENSRDVDGQIVAYDWDFGDGTEKMSGQRVEHTFTRAGTFTTTLIVTDNDGQKSQAAAMVVKVTAPTLQAPVVQIITNPSTPSGNVPFTIAFDASGSHSANGNIIAYEWDFGDGTKVIGNAKISHTYNSPGVYSLTLTVRDVANQTSEQILPIAVRVAAPVAQIEMSRSRGSAPLDVLFNAAASTGSITDFQWTFDDGTQGTGRSIEHTFAQPGVYQIKLKVTDIAGQVDEATDRVVVE